MAHPRLTFFCELEADALQELFSGSKVINDLKALDASVSLGILDLSSERAKVVRRLNKAGIPVIAWLLLPKSQGYWFNQNNASQAAARYVAFKAWTAEHDLRWAGVGLDIEPDFREARQLAVNRWQVLPRVLRRLFDRERLRRAQIEYSALVAQIRADGYHVDSYLIPFIIDEREAGSSLLQRLGGLVDIPADREVLMLYTSYMRPRGPGFLWSYARDAQSVGVGVTGGGVEFEGVTLPPPLDWSEFARDLRLAHRWTHDIHVFSLEGCVQQGFLTRLRDFDWDQPVVPPLGMAEQTERFRKALRVGLWASAHPFTVLGGVAGVLWLFSRRRRDG
ncbi:MAG: hypothetical protein GXP39_05000 [Chloroflexi bacterium]|nr:hypothetical protein [Chloroflexota bacterium]